jgi:hypothetical protein
MKTVMKKVAAKAVKGHENKMHGKKYQAGGMTGLGRAAAMSGREMPEQAGRAMAEQAGRGNAGGAMRGLERAAAMSGRDFSGMGRPATAGRPVGMKTGGKVDGCATKGKTKGKTVKMATGGLPSQAAARAGAAMSARKDLPAQAKGSRPFKKGGKC